MNGVLAGFKSVFTSRGIGAFAAAVVLLVVMSYAGFGVPDLAGKLRQTVGG